MNVNCNKKKLWNVSFPDQSPSPISTSQPPFFPNLTTLLPVQVQGPWLPPSVTAATISPSQWSPKPPASFPPPPNTSHDNKLLRLASRHSSSMLSPKEPEKPPSSCRPPPCHFHHQALSPRNTTTTPSPAMMKGGTLVVKSSFGSRLFFYGMKMIKFLPFIFGFFILFYFISKNLPEIVMYVGGESLDLDPSCFFMGWRL